MLTDKSIALAGVVLIVFTIIAFALPTLVDYSLNAPWILKGN